MWPFGKKDGEKKEKRGTEIPKATAAAIIISVIALAASLGVARWSWLILNEQVRLRTDFEKLKNDEKQTEIQYGIWLDRLKQEGQSMQKAIDATNGTTDTGTGGGSMTK